MPFVAAQEQFVVKSIFTASSKIVGARSMRPPPRERARARGPSGGSDAAKEPRSRSREKTRVPNVFRAAREIPRLPDADARRIAPDASKRTGTAVSPDPTAVSRTFEPVS
jgi:hypothetical protein